MPATGPDGNCHQVQYSKGPRLDKDQPPGEEHNAEENYYFGINPEETPEIGLQSFPEHRFILFSPGIGARGSGNAFLPDPNT